MDNQKQDASDERAIKSARSGLDKRDIAYDGDPPDDETPTGEKVKKEWKRLTKFESTLNSRERKVERAEAANETTAEQLDADRQAHEEAVEAFQREQAEHEEAVAAYRQQLEDQNARELEITRREAEAEAGFRELQRETLDSLRAERTALQERIDAMDRELATHGEQVRADARAQAREVIETARQEADELRNAAAEELESQRRQLKSEREEIDTARRDVEADRRRVKDELGLIEVERELLEERRTALAEMVERRVGVELRETAAALQATEEERDRLRSRLLEVEATLRSAGSDPVAMARRLDALQHDNDRLTAELATRPDVPRLAELEERASDAVELRREVSELERQIAQYDGQLRRQGIAVAELEVMRDERDALETQKGMLKSALDELRTQFDDIQEKDTIPFPACSDIDTSPEHGRPATAFPAPPLGELVEAIRGSMAAEQRYYTALDTQLFMAGLAATRLHLLQGHSGTGKTTLPLEFAKAIGGRAEIIEVQAGWRDQDDLFGYYNAFEGRFYESAFTRELYLAQSPRYRDVPVFIVLDEMNLAHPEQYFSTILSQLENPKGERSIPLVPRSLNGAPERFIEKRAIEWPENVWFIGTANQDETTVAFADKTVDRSHVHELPIAFTEFRASRFVEHEPISYSALIERFDEAVVDHADAGRKAVQVLRDELAPLLNKVDASWSNRVDKQIQVFVPVAIAAGASKADAVDHVLAMKILRKVMNRHDLREEHLERVADQVELAWTAFGGDATKSVGMLRSEASRLGGHLELE